MGTPTSTAYDRLRPLLKEANYDEALKEVSGWDLRTVANQRYDPLTNLRFRCMLSDVLDYAGLYDQAALILQDPDGDANLGEVAEDELSLAKVERCVSDEKMAKQQCWALILGGMTHYRKSKKSEFELAMKCFKLAVETGELLQERYNLNCVGTLARAWYCIGLVAREQHRLGQARTAFREALRLAERGIQERIAANESTASFVFNMARSAGLGMGWIAYNEANLTEAAAMLALARRMLASAKAGFISAYLDTVQAAVLISESKDTDGIKEAVSLLDRAHSILAPATGISHTHYDLRCQNRIALAYFNWARLGSPSERESCLSKAEMYTSRVMNLAKPLKSEVKSHCTACIIESRIKRLRATSSDPSCSQERSEGLIEALRIAERAKKMGKDIESIQVDASIAIGEVQFELGAYPVAVTEFIEALVAGKEHRKEVAACHLHLSRAYLFAGEPAKAKEHFEEGLARADDLQNAFLVELSQEVGNLISKAFKNFELTPQDVLRDGHYKVHLDSLRRWLAGAAISLDNDNYADAARRLCIDVHTLKQWLSLHG